MRAPFVEVSKLLHEAAETHHQVFRITDGADDDWASWYSDWLTRLSELPDLLAKRPVRSALTAELVQLDQEYSGGAHRPDQPWEEYYAERLVEVFA